MSFWQTIKAKFSKKQELPQVPTMEAINQQNADLTQKEQSVETLLISPAPSPEETQVMPAPEAKVSAEPAPIATAPVKKAAPKRKPVKKAAKKAPVKKAVKKAAPKKKR